MRIALTFLFFLSSNVIAQDWWGLKVGMTTATPTGNYDSYDFDFIDSFSPGYEFGLFGDFQLSDVIKLKPEFSYRKYIISQEIVSDVTYNISQTHSAVSSDLNFDIKLNSYSSLIFGMGVDYILKVQIAQLINTESIDPTPLLVNEFSRNERLTPFSNIGICFTLGRRVYLDLEYRHLLNNIKAGNLFQGQLVTLDGGGVKLHMISVSMALLF